MSENTQDRAEREASCFPVNKELVDKSLKGIEVNIQRVTVTEGSIVQVENPALNLLLWSRHPNFSDSYIEGALWTHFILRSQAEERRATIPRIEKHDVDAYLDESVQAIKMRGVAETIDQETQRRMRIVESEEPELAGALKEMTRFNADKADFFSGAFDVYFPLKKAALGL